MQSNYMGVGGTNWGWLPDPDVYTSYDYGAAIRETGEIGTPADPNDIAGSKFGENKLINDFETSVAPLTKTQPVAAPDAGQPGGHHDGPGQPDRRHPVRLPAPGRRHLHRHGEHAPRAERRTRPPATPTTTPTRRCTYTGHLDARRASSAGYTSGDYDSTESWSTQAGASMSVTFTGTARAVDRRRRTTTAASPTSTSTAPRSAPWTPTPPAGKEFQQVLFSQTGLSAGSHTLTITVTGQQNPASSADTVVDRRDQRAHRRRSWPTTTRSSRRAARSPWTAATPGCCWPTTRFGGGEHLVYSTSELMTQATIGGQAIALLYDPAGTDGETVLRYASQPTVTVLSGTVQSTWDASRGDLRLDYTHQGLAEVRDHRRRRPAAAGC